MLPRSCCPSLQIGVDDFDELIRRIGVERARIPLGVDEVGADVVLDHFGHQAGDAAANAGDHMHDALAFGFFVQRPLDRLDLAANAADPGEQLFLFSDGMCHDATYRVPTYAMSMATRSRELTN